MVPEEKQAQGSPVYSEGGSAGLDIAHIAGNVCNVVLTSITDDETMRVEYLIRL